jgi:serine/threonine protein kinase
MVFVQYPHGDLFTRVQQLAPFPLYLVRCYFYQLLLAVKHLHDHGLCHLDISLENTMLDHKGQLKLLDLGLAQFYVPHQKWMGPYRNGKPHYWSPDIWNGLSFYGPHADLFACGVFLWCLITAEFPFDRAVMAEDCRYQMICENKINQLLQYSKFIKRIETNTQVIDMLYRLLNPQSHLAFQTVDEVLNHEWFQIKK